MPRQLDIKTAFLYGALKEEIFMELPVGYRKEYHVVKGSAKLYGTKKSSRIIYICKGL